VWKTCCALHNWLLEVDGLNERWENGVSTDWEGQLGYHDVEDMDRTIPFIINHVGSGRNSSGDTTSYINSIVGDQQFDCSGMGSGDVGTPWMCTNNTSTTSQEILPETGLVVRTVAFNDFRKRLVIHFKKQWE
jgi:hypothetical protein